MKLRTRILTIGALLVMLQLGVVGGIIYYGIKPHLNEIQISLVENKLRRCQEIIQRELYHLQQLTQAVSQESLIQSTAKTSPQLQNIALDDRLQTLMFNFEFNLLCVLDNAKRVHWEKLMDLKNDQSYPQSIMLTSLWDNYPAFLEHDNLMSIQAGIYQSPVGPMLLVSTPIPSDQFPQTITGTLVIGKIMNDEFVDLINSLALTDLTISPLGGSGLRSSEQAVLERLKINNKDILIVPYGRAFRGYISLNDLSGNPAYLISANSRYALGFIFRDYLWGIIGAFLVLEVLFIGAILSLLYQRFNKPMQQLAQQLNLMDTDHSLIQSEAKADPQIQALAHALQGFITRQFLLLNRETTLAFREGSHQTRQQMLQGFDDIAHLLFEGMVRLEKNLSLLPTRDIEWIAVQLKVNPELLTQGHHANDTAEKLADINNLIRQYQKDTWRILSDLQNKTLQNATLVRALSRGAALTPGKSPTKRKKIHLSKNDGS